MSPPLTRVSEEQVLIIINCLNIKTIMITTNIQVNCLLEHIVSCQQISVNSPFFRDLKGANSILVLGISEVSRCNNNPRLNRVQSCGEELLKIIFDVRINKFGNVKICYVNKCEIIILVP